MSTSQQLRLGKAVSKLRQLQALSPDRPIHVSLGGSGSGGGGGDRGRSRDQASDNGGPVTRLVHFILGCAPQGGSPSARLLEWNSLRVLF